MQTHYGFIRSLNLAKSIVTPFIFRNQFTVYSSDDSYSRKREVEDFLRNHYSTLGYSHVLIARTRKPYKLAGEFVLPSRANMFRFLNLLRVIKPNNSFLRFEAFHTGKNFQSSTLHESDEIPHFLSIKKDPEIEKSDIQLLKKVMSCINRLKIEQKYRINNFYSYLEYSVKGPTSHRPIWIFISVESLFKFLKERGRFERPVCKRVAFFLAPVDSKKRQRTYGSLDRGYDFRNKLVHGSVINHENVKKELVKLEPIIWEVGKRLLTSNKKWIKLFSSEDAVLEKYFSKIEKQVL